MRGDIEIEPARVKSRANAGRLVEIEGVIKRLERSRREVPDIQRPDSGGELQRTGSDAGDFARNIRGAILRADLHGIEQSLRIDPEPVIVVVKGIVTRLEEVAVPGISHIRGADRN